ncbi:hypothetical protein BH09ACT4_BH09ACT4_21410 [soil metagenome]
MRVRATLFGALGAVAALAGSWQLGVFAEAGASSTTTTPAPPGSGSAGATNGTIVGSVESTRYGNVQVNLVVAGGKITDVVAVQLTNDGGRSVQISNQAAPILRSEVLAAQSAKVSNVSGATYTSKAYLLSVQSALDQAGL